MSATAVRSVVLSDYCHVVSCPVAVGAVTERNVAWMQLLLGMLLLWVLSLKEMLLGCSC